MGSSAGTLVWPFHCLLLFLQRQLCVLDYVWPAVDAFLWVELGGDLITVLPNCRSVCMGAGREWKESKLEKSITQLLSPGSPSVDPERLTVERRKEGIMRGGELERKRMQLSKLRREKNRLRTSKLQRQAECQQLVISGSWLRQ